MLPLNENTGGKIGKGKVEWFHTGTAFRQKSFPFHFQVRPSANGICGKIMSKKKVFLLFLSAKTSSRASQHRALSSENANKNSNITWSSVDQKKKKSA